MNSGQEPDTAEKDDSGSATSCSSSSSDTIIDVEPQLHHDVLMKISEYLSFEDLSLFRSVNQEWRNASGKEFRKKSLLTIVDQDPAEFLIAFNTSQLVTENLWIQNLNFLQDHSLKEWMTRYGPQIKTLKLGTFIDHEDINGDANLFLSRVFTIRTISSYLRSCPNLKALAIPAPFSIDLHGNFNFNATPIVSLDHLEIGSQYNVFSDDDNQTEHGTTSLLLNILKCVQSLKCLKVINLDSENFNGLDKLVSDDRCKNVLEKISELHLYSTPMDPRKFVISGTGVLKFQNLNKLIISSFCDTTGEFYFPILFAALSHQLVELEFRQCDAHQDLDCPKLEDCFPITTIMHRLKVFRVYVITEWAEPTLKFLHQLPFLTTLEIKISNYHISQHSIGRLVEELHSRQDIYPTRLKNLILACGSDTVDIFTEIRRNFPSLETFETEYYGLDLSSVIDALSGGMILDLKIHVNRFFGFHCLQTLINIGMRKFTIESNHRQSGRRLFVDLKIFRKLVDCKSVSPCNIILIGMKVIREEYLRLDEMLSSSGSKIRISLFDCILEDDVE